MRRSRARAAAIGAVLLLALGACDGGSGGDDARGDGGQRAAAPGPQLNCIDDPSSCGYPDGDNTGVPDGVTLAKVPQEVTEGDGWEWDPAGFVRVFEDDAVLENVEIDGNVEIDDADGVTVRNTRIRAGGETWGIGIRNADDATIADSEIGVVDATPRLMVGVKDIYGEATGTRVLRNEIVNTSTGVQVYSGLIEGNYIHSMGIAGDDHVNGTTSNGSTEQLVIKGNTVLNEHDQTDAISLFQDFGVEANRLITGNLLAGGGYVIYAGGGDYGPTYGIKIINNRISPIYYPDGGTFGTHSNYEADGEGNEWSGNIWDHSGEPIHP